MSDRIPSITDKDRLGLNIKGASKKKVLINATVIVAVIIVGLASAYTFLQRINGDGEVVTHESDTNYLQGTIADDTQDVTGFMEETSAAERLRAADEAAIALKAADEAAIAEKKAKEEAAAKATPKADTPPPLEPKTVTRQGQSERDNQPPPLTPEEQARIRKMSGAPIVQQQSTPQTGFPTGEYDSTFDAPEFADGYASARPEGALDFMLMHGTAIPCAIYTQIISEQSGYVTCRVTQDVYSANGAALLVERGSLVSGTQSVAMEQGKGRIFTTWADIATPMGVNIRIDSLGTGALGAAGIDAWVDNHYAQRFGGAIMLSFVDDALATLSDRLSSKTEVTFDNSTQNAGEMAAKALDASINIAPTGYAFIGQRINILVVRNIDMSNVYAFE